jgi:hypothetical protein
VLQALRKLQPANRRLGAGEAKALFRDQYLLLRQDEARAVAAIPRLPNGKVDRAALPAPEDAPRASAPARADPPATPTEVQVAGIWAALLKSGDIRADDNFFDIGGHSLLAMQAILTMEKACGKRIDRNRYVFETLRQIARAYDEAEPAPEGKPGRLRGMFSALLRRTPD